MASALIRKLDRWNLLSTEDHAILEGLGDLARRVERYHHLIRQGDDPDGVFLLLDGWACRYKLLPDGKRQIVGILLPGDLCDVNIFILDHMDHGIIMLCAGIVAQIPRAKIMNILDDNPRITRALWWATLVDEAILREWIVNVGGRDSHARLAHLICELYFRMEHIGLAEENSMEWPLTQEHVGDALGMTSVHVNRMARKLREEGLVTVHGQTLTISNFDGLKQLAGFDRSYLHARSAKRAAAALSGD